MEILIGGLFALLFLSGASLAKNKVEQVVETSEIVNSDSFTAYDSLFSKYGSMYRVPFVWLKAICMNESSLGQYPTVALGLAQPSNRDGSASQDGLSWGIMQVTEVTARDFDPGASYFKLNNAEYSVEMACKVLQRSMRSFPIVTPDSEKLNIMAYNAGIGRVNQMLSGDPLTDNQQAAIDNALTYYDRFLRNKQIVVDKQADLAQT